MISIEKVSKICKDYTQIKNYEDAVNDQSQVWVCHHILGEILTSEQLKDHDFYYDVPPCMLKFVTRAEHARLHMSGKHLSLEARRKVSEAQKGRTFTEESRRKMSESQKGKNLSDEHRRKLSESRKGKHHSDETRRKQSESHKGLRWKLIDGNRVYYRNEDDILLC